MKGREAEDFLAMRRKRLGLEGNISTAASAVLLIGPERHSYVVTLPLATRCTTWKFLHCKA